MSAQLGTDEIQRLAKLARLELTPQEQEEFAQQLSQILGHIQQLASVDVTGVEPMSHPFPAKLVLRADQVEPTSRDEAGLPKVLSTAPELEGSGFRVPPIF